VLTHFVTGARSISESGVVALEPADPDRASTLAQQAYQLLDIWNRTHAFHTWLTDIGGMNEAVRELVGAPYLPRRTNDAAREARPLFV
jgi:hypothetical protein